MSSIGNASARMKPQTGEVLPLFPAQDPVPFEEPSQRHEDLEFLRRFRPQDSLESHRSRLEAGQGPAAMSALSDPRNFIAEGSVRRVLKRHGVWLGALAGLGFVGLLGTGAALVHRAAPFQSAAPSLAPSRPASGPVAAKPQATRPDGPAAVTTLTKTARDPAPPAEPGPARLGLDGAAAARALSPTDLFAAAPAAERSHRQSITDLPPPAMSAPVGASGPATTGPEGPSAGPAPERSPAEIQQLDGFVARGEQLLTSGEVVSARLFFQRAAAQGDPRGARGVARSYDPAVLKGLPVIGLEGNRAEADRWYLKAADLERSWPQTARDRAANP
ncbi:hypothetical protein MET9862_04463 [Methylobacterium symbioticum]|uniref:Sel1 repeat family protein n=2 Tax=Methylobacterium symbioticum TaxID=2584084 RepID=A0A509EKR7_9HYPH|nr:hypothetical protein MET9862_04463 [Methylobacterium symbioticum]